MKQAGNGNDEDESEDDDSDNDNSDDNDDDAAGGGSVCRPAKKTAHPRIVSLAGSAAKGAATGQSAGIGLSTKWACASRYPNGTKSKRAAHTTLALTDE